MQTVALIQLQMHKMQQIKTVPVCCLCRIAVCSTLLRLIMVRMSDWALPFMTLSLSLATSSSSGPRGGISVLPHHGLNGEDKFKLCLLHVLKLQRYLSCVCVEKTWILFIFIYFNCIWKSFCTHAAACVKLQALYALYKNIWITLATSQQEVYGRAEVKKTEDAQGVHCPQRECFLTHLKRMKNLYCSKTVKMKKITPSTAIANKFFPTKSHCRGSRVCFAPKEGKKNKWQTCIYTHVVYLDFLCVESKISLFNKFYNLLNFILSKERNKNDSKKTILRLFLSFWCQIKEVMYQVSGRHLPWPGSWPCRWVLAPGRSEGR